MSTLDLIAAERRTIATELEQLRPDQLATQSLCGAWTVHDIGAHLLVPLTLGKLVIVQSFARSLGNFDKVNADLTSRVAKRPMSEIAAELRAKADHRFRPPGFGFEAPITDLLVHGEDFRRPLGLAHEFDPAALRTALDFAVSAKAEGVFRPRGRAVGVRFVATDLGWSSGAGESVEGAAIDVLLALTGRAAALKSLTGAGVKLLASR